MKYISTIVITILATIVVFSFVNKETGLGTATPNMQAWLRTATTTTVGNHTDITLFTAKDYCSSRVVSTFGTPIVLSFSSSDVNPSATVGHIQGASTTVAYDSGLYGCGAIVASASASTSVYTAEFTY